MKEQKQTDIEGVANFVSAIPGFLLCAVTAAMLLLDIFIPEMSEAQYKIYPLLIRITLAISIICAGSMWKFSLNNESDDYLRHLDIAWILLTLFILCMIISTCANGFSKDALLGVRYRYLGVIDFALLIIGYMYCSRRIGSEILKRALLFTYLGVADLIALFFLIDWKTGGCFSAFQNKNEPAAVFFHGNHYGYYIVMASAVAVGFFLHGIRQEAVISAGSLVLQLAALAVNRSLGCILAVSGVVFVSVLWSLIKRNGSSHRAGLLAGAFVFLGALAIVLIPLLRIELLYLLSEIPEVINGTARDYAGHGRWGLWQLTVQLIRERPITGYGCEGISEILYSRTGVANPHCEVLTIAAFFGIPAAVFYTAGIILFVLRGLKSDCRMSRTAAYAAMGYFISSMFGVAMFYTVPFFWVFIGLADSHLRDPEISEQ